MGLEKTMEEMKQARKQQSLRKKSDKTGNKTSLIVIKQTLDKHYVINCWKSISVSFSVRNIPSFLLNPSHSLSTSVISLYLSPQTFSTSLFPLFTVGEILSLGPSSSCTFVSCLSHLTGEYLIPFHFFCQTLLQSNQFIASLFLWWTVFTQAPNK